MRIAGLTFHNSSNYGSVLQAYALQHIIERLGNTYEIINYSNEEKQKYDSLLKKNKEQSLIRYIAKLLDFPYNAIKKRKFIHFSEKYLKTSKSFFKIGELEGYSKEKDAIICGSDQIWNPEMIRFDQAYFLKFVSSAKKIAYAASIGKSVLTNDEIEFFKRMLEDFIYISTREDTGLRLIKEITGKDCSVVLDPTLLLTGDEWREIAYKDVNEKESKKKGGYIFAYILGKVPEAIYFLKRLHRDTGLPIKYCSNHFLLTPYPINTCIPDPKEWIRMIDQADFVVTTSFHGTAFATNLHKDFYSFAGTQRFGETKSRLTDFCRMINQEDRLNSYYSNDIITKKDLNFDITEQVLGIKRKESIRFLVNSLKAVEENSPEK